MEAGTYDHIWSPTRNGEGWGSYLMRAVRSRAYRIFSDETLVRRARARDHAAFDALVARYRNRLYTMAVSSLGDEGEAGDVVCEMVISAFKDIDSFNSKCAPGTWLYMHGFRAVFARLNVPPGKYAFEDRSGASLADGD